MADHGDWIEPPIGETLREWGHKHLPIEGNKPLNEKKKWELAFKMWEKIFDSDAEFMKIVEANLAKPCQVVLLSLLSWRRSEYDYQELSTTAWKTIESYSETPNMSYEEWKVNLAFNLTEQVRDLDEMDRSPLKSDYQVMHAMLWIEEMTLRINPSESYGELQRFRRQALEAAVVQRLSWFLTKDREAYYPDEDFQWLYHGPSLKHMVANDTVTAQARLDACPWINDRKPAGPHFLYDIDQAKTVEITEKVPPYAVISHTWGRWATGKKVQVEGVGWLVPQNQRFSVECLPNALKGQRYPGRAFENIRYVWIDLFCIPQDEGYVKRADETKKHAHIFRGATVGYVWMNNVSDWRGAAAAIEFLSLLAQDRKNSVSFYFTSNAADALGKARKESREMAEDMQLFGEWEGPADDPDTINKDLPPEKQAQVPNGWLTSLWTLQEYGLRPDMQILNQHWEPLAICQAKSSANRLKVTIGVLGCLARIVDEEALDLTDAHSLGTVLQFSSLGSLQTTQRSAFLCASHSRHVVGERYEAMMSVTGAPKWFRQCNKENGYDPVWLAEQLEHKVFEQWPKTFIWDLRWQEGASFFAVTDVEIPSFWAIFRNQLAALESQLNLIALTQENFRELLPTGLAYTAVGTLMPIDFTTWCFRKKVVENCPLQALDHMSVSYWTMKENGLLDVPTAGVLASSDSLGIKADPNRPLRVHLKPIAGSNLFSMATYTEEVELQEYLNNDLAWWPWHKYAVILKASGDTRKTPLGVGVILAELPPGGTCEKDVKSTSEPCDDVRRFGRLQTFQFMDNQPWYGYTVNVEEIPVQALRPGWFVY